MHTAPTRRSMLKAGVGLLAAGAFPVRVGAAEPPHDVTYAEDFDELWRTLAERYCYFGEKRTNWAAVRTLYRSQALAAASRDDFAAIVDRILGELYDAHTHRGDAADGTARLPYYDLWVESGRAGGALVTSVRDGSAAADAGVVPGDTIMGVDGMSVATRAAAFMPRCLSRPDPAATAYALNVAVSGQRGQPRRLALRSAGGSERSVLLPLKIAPKLPDVESRLLPGGYGCIVIRSFADQAVIDAFDAALLRFRETPGLIIDVRQNGGGDTGVARPIMGRFITEQKPYARMRRREACKTLRRFILDRTGGYPQFSAAYRSKRDDGRNWDDETLNNILGIYSYPNGPKALLPLAVQHDPASVEDYAVSIADDLIAGRLVIFDQSTGDPDMNRDAAERVMWSLFNRQKERFTNPDRDENGQAVPPPDVLVYAEEAHNLLPASSSADVSNIWSRVAKEGSKYRIGIVYATQEPSSIQSNIMKNTDNWFVAHLNNSDETRELRKYHDFDDFVQSILQVPDPGFIRMRTLSNPYIVPIQVARFRVAG